MRPACSGNARCLRKQLEVPCPGNGLGAVVRAELAVDVARVGLDGAHGDEEVSGDLRVGLARGEEAQHLQLSRAQRLVETPGLAGSRRRSFALGLGGSARRLWIYGPPNAGSL